MLFARPMLAVGAVCCALLAITAADWPTFLSDGARSGAGSDTTLSAANASQLVHKWTFTTGGAVAPSASVVGGVAYVGSWDGYEYAIDANTGALRWKTSLGLTNDANCSPPTLGITSAAAVVGGVVYVGGGDAYWYALDAATGSVLWKVFTGDNSATGAHYNWASPLIYNGHAYIGISSNCDNPLVQGQLLDVDLSTHQVVHTLNFVPSGQVGGGIWTSPAVDAATNTIYVTTGTIANSTQQYSEAIVSIDASAMTIKSSWQLPVAERTQDSDWGTTPTLFSDANGTALVGAINKNGFVYAWNRANLAAGPVWKVQIAQAGECPTCGDGSVSSMAFGNGTLYAAGGKTTINGTAFNGAVRALDPATGAFRWEHGAPGVVVPALAYDNGLVVDGAGSTMEVLNATNGGVLYTYRAAKIMYGAPSVANGEIFIGSTDNNEYAFGLPSAPPPPTGCPSGWSCADIGSPTPAGTQSANGSTWTVQGGGSDIWGTADHFRYIWQTQSSSGSVTARIDSQTNTSAWAKAGVMLRSTTDPGSPDYYAVVTPSNGIAVQYRSSQGGSAAMATTLSGTTPAYLSVGFSGSSFTTYTSSDGNTWTAVPNSTVTISAGSTWLAGVAVTSHDNQSLSTVGVSEALTSSSSQPPLRAAGCPTGWTCADIDNPYAAGGQSLSGSTWTIRGGGTDIHDVVDQFHYAWRPLGGNGSVSAHVTSQTNTNAWAKAGVMLRLTSDPSAPNYALLVTPGNGITVQWRLTQGGSTANLHYSGTVPAYLKVTRSGSSFSAYTSGDGSTWTVLSGSTVTINGMSGALLQGLAVTSHAWQTVSTVTMDSVSTS